MDSPRIVLCGACGSEGRIYHEVPGINRHGEHYLDWSEECSCCEGTGGEIIETEEIDLDDLDSAAPPQGSDNQ